MSKAGYFNFFGEEINPELYVDSVNAREDRIAKDDARIFSGDLAPLVDAMDLHAVLQGVIRSFEYAEEEEEEDEEV